TYDASAAPMLISTLLEDQLDFVNAARISTERDAYRTGHRFGNWLLTSLVQFIFGRQFRDMLSGYKVLSRRFVKTFPAMSSGFETETELSVHALELRMPSQEVDTVYKERPAGSTSKHAYPNADCPSREGGAPFPVLRPPRGESCSDGHGAGNPDRSDIY